MKIVRIKFLNSFLYSSYKLTKFTGPNKDLVVLDRRAGAHLEDGRPTSLRHRSS